MALAPLRYCSTPRCPNKVPPPCPVHARERRLQERRHYTGTPGLNYGRRWQREAKRYLAMHPWCVLCPSDQRSLATEVDHIQPHQGSLELFWEPTNWQAACKPCHSSKTARELGHRGA